MKNLPLRNAGRAGFTLLELLVVITIIVMLFALTVGGFTYAQKAAARDRTQVNMKAITSGLNAYNTDFGEYPEPNNAELTESVDNKTYFIGGAAMLYQAMTGDGLNHIKGAADTASNGELEDIEAKNVKIAEMPPNLWRLIGEPGAGMYFLVDGFSKPFQYVKAAPVDPTGVTAPPEQLTINPTYDLWSYGEDEDNIMARSVDTLNDPNLRQASVKWFKNW